MSAREKGVSVEIKNGEVNQKYIYFLAEFFGEPTECKIPVLNGKERVIYEWEQPDNGEVTRYKLNVERQLNFFGAGPFYVHWAVSRGGKQGGDKTIVEAFVMSFDYQKRCVRFLGRNEDGSLVEEILFAPRDPATKSNI